MPRRLTRALSKNLQACALLADDEACLRTSEAYDRQAAAQIGEPNPHDIDWVERMGDYVEWAADWIACAKEAIRALIEDGETP